ncbi:putative serine-threonine protein kinase plant-type [Tripterygium wilfordii]|uniref:Putative serine-threonine protein kinase plant-type n=1 Tax=Tripterygium wilfordii TaxID=458696 RepID=A0A7J7CPP6_TRIWF|nr:putative serine-threonine protein kinase plant-type [Tripterygium wilfordii]
MPGLQTSSVFQVFMKTDMGASAFMLSPSLLILLLPLSSSTLNKGSHLSVENPGDVLVSPHNVFTAGFYAVGDNAYCFAVWFSDPFCSSNNCTIVWMANRDEPVNGKRSRLSLLDGGNVVLADADHSTVWTTNTASISSTQLDLYDSGNLVLHNFNGTILWQSFDSPTDTLLPEQPLTRKVQLVSARSQSNFSSGFFKLYFDNDNVLRLLFDGPEVSDIYWPDPELMTWENGRSTYNNSRIAVLDSKGNFSSTDDFTFLSADFGLSRQRRLKIDFDGNLRLYSRVGIGGKWVVTWQAMSQPCRIHGTCGPNSICSYVPSSGRKCSCIPGYKVTNPADWSSGCEPEFNIPCTAGEVGFLQLTNVEFFGYDFGFYPNCTLECCKRLCLETCNCKGFQFKFIKHDHPSGIPYCYPKTLLLNGHHSPNFQGDLYLKVPKTGLFRQNDSEKKASLDCPGESLKQLNRTYARQNKNRTLEALLLIAIIVGAVEFIIFLVPNFLIRTHKNRRAQLQGLNSTDNGEETQHKGMATWVREKMNDVAISGSSSIEDIIDPKLEGEYDKKNMEILVAVALKCVVEDRNARPTMSQVVEMLTSHENDKHLRKDDDHHME